MPANFKKFNKTALRKLSLPKTQIPEALTNIIDDQTRKFGNPISITESDVIPHTDEIPGTVSNNWLKINGPICVYTDMANSTALSARAYPKSTAKIYQLYTNTAVQLFHYLGAEYIDIKGDGVFALFNKDKPHTALAAAVTFKTFFESIFTKKVSSITEGKVTLGNHIGIDQRTILVKQLGLRKYNGRTDKQNEVWAGKTVNMAAKLASLYDDNRIVVSDRFFANVTHKGATHSCGCDAGIFTGQRTPLWTKIDLEDEDKFDFDTGYLLGSSWCSKHGTDTLTEILLADEA
ncbi:hypothetical protein ACMXYX_15855 [Neptuniibacter sp. QD72_48]|uniref:hypothetical protein n=1 Tax=Neptuniibacter sp. QD72_48 TaxID=3398214 RepID=UPI0039F498DC